MFLVRKKQRFWQYSNAFWQFLKSNFSDGAEPVFDNQLSDSRDSDKLKIYFSSRQTENDERTTPFGSFITPLFINNHHARRHFWRQE